MAVSLAPTCAADVATMLSDAANSGGRVVPVGHGSKCGWHHDPFREEGCVSTLGLLDGFEHYAGDLVATLPAGMTLAEANRRLAAAGQWLPIDPPFAEQTTIGGLVATNASGPRRHRFGAPRDLIVGCEFVTVDGRTVKAGGRVVKNVAGYDLSRLLCGSHGSLAVITSATFKLSPLPPRSRTLVSRFPSVSAALDAAQTIVHSALTPSALEFDTTSTSLLTRFETTANVVAEMSNAAYALLGGELVEDDDEARIWAAHAASAWSPADAAVVAVSVLPARSAQLLSGLNGDASVSFAGRAGVGVFLVRAVGPVQEQQRAIETVRANARVAGGHSTVLRASDEVRHGLAPSAPAPAASMMHAIKQRFDPAGVLRRVPDGQ